MTLIHEEGLASYAERKRAVADAEQRRAAALAWQQSSKRLGLDRQLEQSEKQALLADLERQAALLQTNLSSLDPVMARLEHDLELHRITAPVSEQLGEVVPLRVGSVVAAGDRLAAVIPPGTVRPGVGFLPKPFTPEALGEKLQQLLEASTVPQR